jgi:LysM repeat protein
MTVPVDAEAAPEQRPGAAPGPSSEPDHSRPTPTAPDVVVGTCPYLTSAGGSWRLASPSRDHRCGAVDPPAAQPTDKQRRHCLSPDHLDCSIFRAARTARATSLAAGADPALVDAADRRRRPVARTAPILLEQPRLVDQAVRLKLDRAPGQAALIALMIVAFAIVALTRLSSGAAPAPSPSARPSNAVVAPSVRPSRTPLATASPNPTGSAPASAAPAFRTTYKVKKDDTLFGIATYFGTTEAKIRVLNGLKTSTLKIGQVLKIP